jgi:hypothetical protein
MDSFSVDVAIIGGGPVGLFASHLLSSRGVTVAVLEKELDEFPYPRAVQFNSDILRSFRSASTKLSRLMLEHVQLVPEMVCTRSPMKSNTVMCNTGGAKVRPVRKMTCALALCCFRSSVIDHGHRVDTGDTRAVSGRWSTECGGLLIATGAPRRPGSCGGLCCAPPPQGGERGWRVLKPADWCCALSSTT